MKKFKFRSLVPSTFKEPDMLPASSEVAADWQMANKSWWEDTPMKYDWYTEIRDEAGTIEYFNEIDKRVREVHEFFAPSKTQDFDSIIPYEILHDAKVLEIGVGNGTHAELLASNCKSYTGIDLTSYATEITTKRFHLKNLVGSIHQMDAELLEFEDNTFDFVWSWGVIHHSSNPSKIIDQINRVLKPGGRASIMVYHKSWWHYYIVNFFIRGLLLGELARYGSVSNIMQKHTDGAIARYYTKKGFSEMISDRLIINNCKVFGHKLEILPLPYSRLKLSLAKLIPDRFARFFLCRMQFGMLLLVDMKK